MPVARRHDHPGQLRCPTDDRQEVRGRRARPHPADAAVKVRLGGEEAPRPLDDAPVVGVGGARVRLRELRARGQPQPRVERRIDDPAVVEEDRAGEAMVGVGKLEVVSPLRPEGYSDAEGAEEVARADARREHDAGEAPRARPRVRDDAVLGAPQAADGRPLQRAAPRERRADEALGQPARVADEGRVLEMDAVARARAERGLEVEEGAAVEIPQRDAVALPQFVVGAHRAEEILALEDLQCAVPDDEVARARGLQERREIVVDARDEPVERAGGGGGARVGRGPAEAEDPRQVPRHAGEGDAQGMVWIAHPGPRARGGAGVDEGDDARGADLRRVPVGASRARRLGVEDGDPVAVEGEAQGAGRAHDPRAHDADVAWPGHAAPSAPGRRHRGEPVTTRPRRRSSRP